MTDIFNDDVNEYALPPENYTGHILIGGHQIPFDARAYADIQGTFHFEVRPLPLGERNPAHTLLMQIIGDVGTANEEFRIECESSAGKRIVSDRATLANYSHRNGALHVSISLAEARLVYQLDTPAQQPTLVFRLKGFRCFPQIRESSTLGRILARGSTQNPDSDEMSGLIVIEQSDQFVDVDWRLRAEGLLDYLVTGLSFATGGH